ncbi:unnamed protein product [Heligmosomoides polygyrus]|uniref:Uncharacterized protein n=1 Tax=Heligmosomoides polygyrus TaxID=6339 RepID=A0A3P8BKJ4_HELPZ|nr:unnamed protein product [Heligmosomoides polygyrus]
MVTFRHGSSRAAYGGLIFAQALAAAENTVDEKLKPHAMHSFFILNVDISLPIEYHVRRVRDGRSFCTRTVEAVQQGKIAFTMQVSFNVVEPDAAVHQDPMPTVPSWKELKSIKDLLPWLKTEIAEGLRRTVFLVCFRYLVAYNTDATMAGSAFRPHFVNDFRPSMLFSLDHSVWMHQHEMRADQWMLVENTSTVAAVTHRDILKGVSIDPSHYLIDTGGLYVYALRITSQV